MSARARISASSVIRSVGVMKLGSSEFTVDLLEHQRPFCIQTNKGACVGRSQCVRCGDGIRFLHQPASLARGRLRFAPRVGIFRGLERITSCSYRRPPAGNAKPFRAIGFGHCFRSRCTRTKTLARFSRQHFEDDPEAMDLLQEWAGHLLTADTSQQKILLMVGPTRSGTLALPRSRTGCTTNPQDVCSERLLPEARPHPGLNAERLGAPFIELEIRGQGRHGAAASGTPATSWNRACSTLSRSLRRHRQRHRPEVPRASESLRFCFRAGR